jgi:hypothetical protein
MFLGLMALVVMATVPLARGRFAPLADIHFAWLPLLFAALLGQILITVTFPSAPSALLATTHVATYVAAGWVLWVNRKIPGIVLIALGATLNAIPIIVNRGTLPANSTAEQTAGVHARAHFANSGVLAHPHLGFLGDTMTSPSFLPFRNVMSPWGPGDPRRPRRARARHLRLPDRPDPGPRLAPGAGGAAAAPATRLRPPTRAPSVTGPRGWCDG